MAAGSSNYWEDLRKQARQLENELDLKLVSFSKLCTSYSSSREGGRDSSDTTPLLNSSQDRMFETMAVEIEQLLAKLTGVNDKMAEYTNTAGVTSLNAALMHTLQRHRDILQMLALGNHVKVVMQEIPSAIYRKTPGALKERYFGTDLSVSALHKSYKSGSGVNNRRTELFLKEHEHLRNSDRLIDDTISIAMATKENMTSQRGILKSIQSRVNTLASILAVLFSNSESLQREVKGDLLPNRAAALDPVVIIAMATKENMTSQRGILKSIQSRVNTLASILAVLFSNSESLQREVKGDLLPNRAAALDPIVMWVNPTTPTPGRTVTGWVIATS
ncbi:UNVERIFIED_CONTAM: hypothetical protein FKN15_010787 [Acipenser sinensis]